MASKGGMNKKRGSVPVGLVSFLIGITMIVFAFYLAFQIFSIPPNVRMDAIPGKPIDLSQAAESFSTVFIRLLLLITMAGFGSMVANRGIKLYASNSNRKKKSTPNQEKSITNKETS
ncbi:MAG: hypothetical protein ACKVQS_06345 [Fimbriimonadaceae bacterium]